ncbi:protein numb homolog [Hydra vulgaris]|uniref:Protein numb homolog n=1 Tax=Hydra vulgaris TaxID=6087 RepID=A0ABM4C135_HYDVU
MLRSSFRAIRRTLSFRKRKNKKGDSKSGSQQSWEHDSVTIKQQGGCSFAVKYLGCLEVSESRGTQVCSQAAHQMKMSSTGKRKQRVTLWVTEDTLRVTDDETKSLVVDQVIEKVSFCTPDPHDDKLFSYICRDGTSRRWLCHSFKGIKDSGERISHAVGCAFAACLAKKQQQNQQNQNLQRNTSTRKTFEKRTNGVVLPQQSVETLQKLNQEEYNGRVNQANQSLEIEARPSEPVLAASKSSPTPKQADPSFARPRPSVTLDTSNFTRHTSLPYRTKKSQTGSSTYQALTEDALPPRLPVSSDPFSSAFTPQSNLLVTVNQPQPVNLTKDANPFSPPNQNFRVQQQISKNPFNEKFV